MAVSGVRPERGLPTRDSRGLVASASTHLEFVDEEPIWALVAFTIFTSTVIHGLTATVTVAVQDREHAEGDAIVADPDEQNPKGR